MADPDRFAAVLCAATLLSACSSESGAKTRPDAAQAAVRAADAGQPSRDGAANADSPEPSRWVGQVEDTDVRVGIVADSAHALLFFCGGASSFATATRWFSLDIGEGTAKFEDETWHVDARLEPNRVSGEVTRDDGVVRPFSAQRVAPDTLAGLYEGQASCGRLGLIVIQPNQTAPIEAQGACVGPGHAPEQVNPILPVAQDNGEIPVLEPGAEDATVRLHSLQLTPP